MKKFTSINCHYFFFENGSHPVDSRSPQENSRRAGTIYHSAFLIFLDFLFTIPPFACFMSLCVSLYKRIDLSMKVRRFPANHCRGITYICNANRVQILSRQLLYISCSFVICQATRFLSLSFSLPFSVLFSLRSQSFVR